MEPVAVVNRALVSTESAFVRRAAKGDAGAFEQLVATRSQHAFRIARAILGNDADARDATQDALVSAWRQLPSLRDPESFDAWLRRILVNACQAQIRSRRHVREISLDDSFDRKAPGPGIAEQVGDTEVLSKAFDRLDVEKRSILVLHYLNHEPVASIATDLKIPSGTAKWRLSEARAALQRALTAEGEARS